MTIPFHRVETRDGTRVVDRMEPGELQPLLDALCRAKTSDRGAEVSAIEALPGHAGFSWGFTLRHGGGANNERLVLRLPPPGVRWTGTADIVRQARVMQALRDTPVPVAAVRWAGDDLEWFGSPYSVVERLPGSTLWLIEALAPGPIAFEAPFLRVAAEHATAALAALHRVDWQAILPDWGPPPSLEDEVLRWDWLAARNADPERSSDPSLTSLAPAVRERLLARIPSSQCDGLFHGDYQWTNLLMHEGRLAAELDWELSGVGATAMDVGWLAVFSDPDSWVGKARSTALLPSAEEIISLYQEALGEPVTDAGWYRALAGYKFALITSLNLTLHRRGKRPDPHWEDIGPSAPRLLERALEMLG